MSSRSMITWPFCLHHVSPCEPLSWYSNTMLTHLCTLPDPMSELVGWSVQLSRSNNEIEHPHAIISFSSNICHILDSSRICLHNPCSGPWNSIHLICNMLSMMFGVNVLHEISHIYPNIIMSVCVSSIWRDHLIKPTLNVPHLGPWSNLHHIYNVYPSSLP